MMEYLYKFFVRGADPQSESFTSGNRCLTEDSSKENNVQHLPDLMRFRSLVDVLALCNFCILANVLDYNTYQFPLSKGGKPMPRQLQLRARYDYNALSPVKCRYYTYIRGLAFNFMNWLITQFDIISTKENPDEASLCDLILEYMENQAYGILHYKQKAEAQKIDGIVNCKAADVKTQLAYLFDDAQGFPGHMDTDNESLSGYDTLSFHDYSWCVIRRTSPGMFSGKQ
jgi:hypothetical protein